jgi:hypothetical protein
MLTEETIGRIRRGHFIEGKTIKEIGRGLKVSWNTIRRVQRSGATSLEYGRLDRSSGDGPKSSMRSWRANQPSPPANN